MRLRYPLFILGTFTTALAGAVGCKAVVCSEINTCPGDEPPEDGGGIEDATPDGTVLGEAGSNEDGSSSDSSEGVDSAGTDANALDAGQPDATPYCGLDASTAYCGEDGGCVDTTSSPEDCGGCGHACPLPANSSATCAASECGFTCLSGYHLCNSQCLSNSDDPSVDPCIASDAFGVFVVAGGTGTGTQASPLGSIAAGMALAQSSAKNRVFVCATGAFAQALTVGASDDGVTVYGGFTSCPTTGTWTWTSGSQAKVTVSNAGPALSVAGLATGVTFEYLKFTAQSATTPGGSSIGAFVSSSPTTFVSCSIQAGNGVNGNNAGSFTNWTGAAPGGATASSADGADGGVNPCLDGTTSSAGGAGATPNGDTAQDGTAVPSVGASNGGSSSSASCTDGNAGANALAISDVDGGAGAASSGTLTASGWTTSNGARGIDGDPGQGGGGGGARGVIATLGGGGGGSGGCGGGGGLGGGTGGSSFALLAFDSMIGLTQCTLTAGNAGNGGNGGSGQAGQGGGTSGAGICNGGIGGIGSGGGGGGGGAGGISASLYWTGSTSPTVNGSSVPSAATLTGFTFGNAGSAGPKGTGANANGSGAPGQDGTEGATPPPSAAVIEAP